MSCSVFANWTQMLIFLPSLPFEVCWSLLVRSTGWFGCMLEGITSGLDSDVYSGCRRVKTWHPLCLMLGLNSFFNEDGFLHFFLIPFSFSVQYEHIPQKSVPYPQGEGGLLSLDLKTWSCARTVVFWFSLNKGQRIFNSVHCL